MKKKQKKNKGIKNKGGIKIIKTQGKKNLGKKKAEKKAEKKEEKIS